jgi:hypothetical protein
VFNPAFPKLGNFRVASGADIGDVIGTQNGVKGDRELLFVGHPANHAAKIIGSLGTHRLTPAVYSALPKQLQGCELVPDDARGLYQAKELTCDELDALIPNSTLHGIEASAEQVKTIASGFRSLTSKSATPTF